MSGAKKTTDNSWTAKENGRAYVFVKSFKHWKSGKTIYAKDYGKKAFKIPLA